MSDRFFSLRLFTVLWGLGYTIAVYFNWTAFRYYPLVNQFSLHDLADQALGPAMSWYGWFVGGAIPAIVIAALVPKRIGDQIPTSALWIVIVMMMLAGWYREQNWFN